MFKLPLHTARRGFNQSVTVSKRYLRSSAATDRTMCVNQAVNEFQTAQGTTTAGRIVNKLSMRLANDRATTRTEQLIWLAKYALETRTTHKMSTVQESSPVAEERPESREENTTSATSGSTGRQS